MPSLAVSTLGCKLNQLETEAVAEAFRKAGFSIVSFDDRADIYIINTCTVTSKAEQKARRVIRKAVRENPAACFIVTGCYAQLEAESLAALSREQGLEGAGGPAGGLAGGFFIVPGERKNALLDLPSRLSGGPSIAAGVGEWLASPAEAGREAVFRFETERFNFHSRPSLKIQDGCDNKCTYCRIRIARGGSVSLNAREVLSRLCALEGEGFAEAVLTGVNLNQYRDGSADFCGLLEYLLAGTRKIALRISSTHINAVTDNFLDIIRHERIRPHFHLSVQSGSDGVLGRMGRPYTGAGVLSAVNSIRAARGDPFMACDIITGFPGETDEDFRATFELCREAGFSWIHAFPYSPRPGTEAWNYGKRVSEREIAARVEKLIELGRAFRREYINRWTGRITGAVIEKWPGSALNNFRGITDNYIRVLFNQEGEKPPAGSRVSCRIMPYNENREVPGNERIDALAVLCDGDINGA